jgi:FixJ family two-component response regulator
MPAAHAETVFIVDDDFDMRSSLQVLVSAMGYQVRTFASAAEFRNQYRPDVPGCLILDIYMPVQNGLELYAELLREGKRLPVIFITGHADVSTAVAAMKSGAIEFLEKPFDRETLRSRIEQACALDASWRQHDARFAELQLQMQSLTARERETLALIAEGAPNKTIAARLGLTERAVEMRRARIMQKFNVRSLAELLDRVVTYRLLAELREALPRGNASTTL